MGRPGSCAAPQPRLSIPPGPAVLMAAWGWDWCHEGLPVKGPLSLWVFGQTQQASGLRYPVFTSPNFVPAEVSCRTSLFPQVQKGRNEQKHSVSPDCQSGEGTLLTCVPCVGRDTEGPRLSSAPRDGTGEQPRVGSVGGAWVPPGALVAEVPRAQSQTHLWVPGGSIKGMKMALIADGHGRKWL